MKGSLQQHCCMSYPDKFLGGIFLCIQIVTYRFLYSPSIMHIISLPCYLKYANIDDNCKMSLFSFVFSFLKRK